MLIYFYLSALIIIFLSVIIFNWLYNQNWFLKLNDDSFKLLNRAFDSYRSEVINKKKLYDIYVDDFCIKNTSQTQDHLNKYGIVVSSPEKNWIKNRVQSLLETRPDLVHKYFQEKTFTYKDHKQMFFEYDTTYPIQKTSAHLIKMKMTGDEIFFSQNAISKKDIKLLFEEKKKLVKDFILKYISRNRKMHLGDRIFGYLIKAELILADTQQEQLDAWHELLGKDIKPSNVKLFSNPSYSRSKSKKFTDLTLLEHLEKIQSFFNEIGLNDVAIIVGKDIQKELSKNK